MSGAIYLLSSFVFQGCAKEMLPGITVQQISALKLRLIYAIFFTIFKKGEIL
jgi:hypothetical protein